MGLNRLKRGYLIQFKRYVDQLTGSSGGRLDGLPRFISQVFDLAQVPGKGMGSSL